ncbi:hypothetical protein KY290_006551 [Solanum tuberosum]|uniref:Cell number regulator 6 n=1 Tax=Solanum tuberosum TaxID=4113 RepID=A0ABQ7WHA0_SOLTU|nr:hypothetical protein KY284_005229 [Solanum tuberosum]KAH0722456.1 hypothetical protein KY289_005500 [Solanum tuberosum]KAH0751848.1 hypothetical protein KY285_004996 [Solanum tuberosum]KAH0780124.1 hypothetical protein KY290_006551 [Solanum tuberosum]
METGTYVRLTKDQESSLQNITPGELNQPIDVQKQSCAKCEHCGQNLPPSYEPPADEDWATGIFGCTEDVDSCLVGLFCPCVLFGRHMESLNDEISSRGACVGHLVCIEGGIALAALTAAFHGIDPDTACLITEGLLFSWWVCGIYTGMARQMLQRKYHLKVNYSTSVFSILCKVKLKSATIEIITDEVMIDFNVFGTFTNLQQSA